MLAERETEHLARQIVVQRPVRRIGLRRSALGQRVEVDHGTGRSRADDEPEQRDEGELHVPRRVTVLSSMVPRSSPDRVTPVRVQTSV